MPPRSPSKAQQGGNGQLPTVASEKNEGMLVSFQISAIGDSDVNRGKTSGSAALREPLPADRKRLTYEEGRQGDEKQQQNTSSAFWRMIRTPLSSGILAIRQNPDKESRCVFITFNNTLQANISQPSLVVLHPLSVVFRQWTAPGCRRVTCRPWIAPWCELQAFPLLSKKCTRLSWGLARWKF